MPEKLKNLIKSPYFIAFCTACVVVVGAILIPRPRTDTAAKPGPVGVLSETQTLRPRGEVNVISPPVPKLSQAIDEKNLSAKSISVFDLGSGTDIYSKNQNQELPIASLTKLMTALVVYRNAKLDENSIILEADRVSISPALGLIAGDTVKLQDLFNAMLVGSDNDAALALANYVERKTSRKFVTLMNEMAQKLSMKTTRFSNPLGFDSSYNFSSAQDLKLLVKETQQYTAFTSLSRTSRFTFKGNLGYTYKTTTTNKLITKYKDVFAVKTGFTENAGGSMITKVEKDGHRIILIVISSDNREQDTLLLRNQVLEKIVWE